MGCKTCNDRGIVLRSPGLHGGSPAPCPDCRMRPGSTEETVLPDEAFKALRDAVDAPGQAIDGLAEIMKSADATFSPD
ncbi:hypothetical protein [Defluviimonas salinarum]|uniref:Uncharacterized protein n=1 Tax=Defluviimonas salinarum TaxID=2992147 RepID=A0ABT3J4A3_9RHOB|nr:hypothetical protein [Defluviimonas salinarum]MCW3782519.1 hypothetical protein [Defluviimonas salinarum]